jgi:hypothetical protein
MADSPADSREIGKLEGHVSEGRPESRRKRWNDIKRTVFTVAVTVTILAALVFVALSLSMS